MSKLGGGGGDGGAGAAAASRAKDEKTRRLSVEKGMGRIDRAFSGFDDQFYDNRRASYLDYYQPQLDNQYGDAKESLLHQLANAGLLKSTAANTAYGKLQKDYDTQTGGLISRAESDAADLRNRVTGERNQLVNQLQAHADPEQALSSSRAASDALRLSTPDFQPLQSMLAPILVGAGNYIQGSRDAETLRGGGGLSATDPRAAGRSYTVR